MSAPTKRADRTEISRAIPLLCKPGAVYELRALGTRKGTVSGYFDNVDKLIEAALIADKLDAAASALVELGGGSNGSRPALRLA